MVGCGDDEPLEIDCPAGYITVRVEADSDEFVCTKAPQAECDEGLIAVPTDDGKFMCMEAHECADDDVAVMQPDGRYQCTPIVDVDCSAGKVVMEASNGTIACIDPPSIDCESGMVPLQSDAGVVTCVPQQNIECDDGMVAMEGSNGLIACVSQTNLECSGDNVPMAGEFGFACVPPTSIDCADGQVPMLTGNGGVACVSQVNLECDDGMVPVQTDNGIFACVEQLDIECTDGKVAVLQGDVFACVAPVDIECAAGKVPVAAPNGTYGCRDPLMVDCDPGQEAVEMDDGTYACIALNEVDCPTDFLPTQAGNGTYSCVEVVTEDIAPGTVSCPTGTELHRDANNQLSCIQLEEIQCADNYTLTRADGKWQCVNYQSGEDIEIVVDGIVNDAGTGFPLEGVSVTVMGLEDVDGNTIVVTTDAAGYYRATGYASGASITAIFNLAGYIPDTASTDFEQNLGDTTATVPEDTHLADVTLTAVPASNLVVAGTVLAGGAPAAGVSVQLRSVNVTELTPTQAQTVTTDAGGLFVFATVPDGEYEVIVSQFDANGDGQPDYQVQRWDCGAGVALAACGEDIGNLQITLQPYFSGDLIYTNLLNLDGSVYLEGTETADLADDVLGETFLMPAAATAMVFQLSDPIDATSAIIELWAVDGAAHNYVSEVGATVSASADGRTLTITPAAALVADSDPLTLYDVRIRTLAWANGTYVQSPTGGDEAHIYVDVKAPMDYAVNPTNLALYWDSNPDAASIAVDSGNAWFRNAAGMAIAPQTFGDLEMSWTVVAGIDDYVVFARWPDSGGSYAGQEWIEVKDLTVTGANSSGTTAWGTIGLDDILDEADWDDLGFGQEVQVTLCSKTAVGDVTPINAANVLTISDSILLGLSPTEDVGDEFEATSYGAAPTLTMTFGLMFSEEISQAFTPALVPIAGSVTLRDAQPLDWGAAQPWDDTATAEITVTDNRYTRCTQVAADVYEGESEFSVIDDTDWDIFAAGDTLLAFPPSTAGAPAWNAGQTMTVTNVFNRLVSLQNPTVGRDSADDNEITIAADAWVCAGAFPTTSAPTGDWGEDDIVGGVVSTEDMMELTINPAPTNFFVGQTACFIGNSDADVTDCREIKGITATTLVFDCYDSEPGDDTEDGCEGPPAGSRVVRLPDAADGVAARGAREITIVQGATLGTNPLRVAIGDLATLEVSAGDALLIDVDGDWATVADRVRATVTQAVSTFTGAAETRNEIGITTTSTAALTEDSVIILLGNKAVQVPTISTAVDSSGNNGSAAGANYDEIAVCDEAIADVDDDAICGADETFVF
jgi:hypothetical protein